MKIEEFLQQEDGGFSSTRLAFLIWAVGVLVIWIISSLKNSALQPIDSTVITILGILMGGKVVQKFGEKPDKSTKEAKHSDSSEEGGGKAGSVT